MTVSPTASHSGALGGAGVAGGVGADVLVGRVRQEQAGGPAGVAAQVVLPRRQAGLVEGAWLARMVGDGVRAGVHDCVQRTVCLCNYRSEDLQGAVEKRLLHCMVLTVRGVGRGTIVGARPPCVTTCECG